MPHVVFIDGRRVVGRDRELLDQVDDDSLVPGPASRILVAMAVPPCIWLRRAAAYAAPAPVRRLGVRRIILQSATWQQDSSVSAEYAAVDPDNRLLGHQQRFRVEAEIVRTGYWLPVASCSRRSADPASFLPSRKASTIYSTQKRMAGQHWLPKAS